MPPRAETPNLTNIPPSEIEGTHQPLDMPGLFAAW